MMLDTNDDLDKAYEELKTSDKKKRSSLINRLRDLDNEIATAPPLGDGSVVADTFLPSSLLANEKPKKKKDVQEREVVSEEELPLSFGSAAEYDPDMWFNELLSFQNTKIKGKRRKNMFDDDGIIGGKKKKKKKEKNADGETLVDFKKEFAPDMALFKNLLIDQNKFTESLQKQYDQLNSVKSTARGVNKQMSDLIENITQARSLSMQLTDKNVQIKKLVAELTMKQRKELGLGVTDQDSAITDFANSYMRSMLDNRKMVMDPSNADIVDMSDDLLFDELNSDLDNLGDDEKRDSEVDKYLQYENRKVKVHAYIPKDEQGQDDFDNYQFVAYAEDGELIDDYPLPLHTKLSINRSTNIATDSYGQKYPIDWSE